MYFRRLEQIRMNTLNINWTAGAEYDLLLANQLQCLRLDCEVANSGNSVSYFKKGESHFKHGNALIVSQCLDCINVHRNINVVTEWFGLGGILKIILFKDYLFLTLLWAQSPTQHGIEYLQEWELHDFSVQPVPLLHI